MFFFIGGIQPRTVVLEKQASACPFCGHIDVRLKRVDHYLSLFFIPLFPVKKGIPFLSCDSCQNILGENGLQEDSVCQHCGKNVDRKFSYCPYCGKTI